MKKSLLMALALILLCSPTIIPNADAWDASDQRVYEQMRAAERAFEMDEEYRRDQERRKQEAYEREKQLLQRERDIMNNPDRERRYDTY
jgi:hypothetical protein